MPELKESPLLETALSIRENTSNGDFLIDRHPEIETSGWWAEGQARIQHVRPWGNMLQQGFWMGPSRESILN